MSPFLKQLFRPFMVCTGVMVLCGAVAMAQDAGAANGQTQGQPAAEQGQRTDSQIEMDVVHALDASAALKNDT